MEPDLRFPRKAKLKSRKAIDALFESGKRIRVDEWSAVYSFRDTPGIQLGAGAPSRNFKKAVDRNRIKRLIREAYRLDQHRWKDAMRNKKPGMDIFILFSGKVIPDFTATQQGLNKLFDKIFVG